MVQAKTKSRRSPIKRALARLRSPRIFIPWLSQNLRHLRPGSVFSAISAIREVRVSQQRLRQPQRHGPMLEQLEPRIMLSNVSWIAPAGGDWGVGANWSTGTVPGTGDTAIIASLNPGAQVTYNTGNSTVAAVQASSPLEITGGTLTVTGATQITGTTLTLDGGTLADTTLSTASGGVIQTASGSTTTLNAATLGANTTLTVVSGSTLDVADNLTLGSGATITVDAGGTLNFVDGTSNTQTISGSGTITLDAASGSYAAAQLNANEVNSGSQVTFANGVEISGSGAGTTESAVTADSNNTIVFDNAVTNAAISAASGGYLQVAGTSSNATVFNGVNLNSNLTLSMGAILDVENGLSEAGGVVISQDSGAQIDMEAGPFLAYTALQPWTGNGMVTAQITGFTGTNTQLAGGVTFLDSNQPGAAFGAVTVSSTGVITFQWQATANGPISSTSANGSVADQLVRIVHWNGLVAGFYSSDDVHWTQIGTSQAVNFINSTNLAGLTMSDSGGASSDAVMIGSQSVSSVIPAAFLPPTVTTAAAANPGTVAGTTVNLTVAGQANDGQAGTTLIYTWSLLGTAPAAVTFSLNGSNAAASTTATFTAAGTYEFQATISDNEGVSATSDVNVVVNQALTDVAITPSSAALNASQSQASTQLLNATTLTETSTQQFTAVAYDQFGTAMASQPTFNWTVASGSGTISSTGLYTAPDAAGTATIQAAIGSISSGASVAITSQSIAQAGTSSPLANGNFTAPFVGSTAFEVNPSIGWSDQDIGNPASTGFANFSGGNIASVTGGGDDIWNTSDQFNFASESFTGDATVTAQVTSQTNTNAWAKAGVMMRDTSAAGSMFADVMVTPTQGVAFMWRNATNGTCQIDGVSRIVAPVWVKLTRSGSTYTGYYSTDGSTWILIGSTTMSFTNSTDMVGLAVTSCNVSATSAAAFSNVSVSGTAFPASLGWTFVNGAGVTGTDSDFTSGNPLPSDGATQVGYVQRTGSVSQTATFAAGDYTLSLLAAQRENWQHGGQTLQILVDGTPVYTFTPTSVNYLTYTTRVFNLTAGSHTITIAGTDPNGLDNTAFISDVQINAALEQTILNVFQNVYNNIAYEPYAGLQKGPAATAATGSGNDWDQAALLISNLEAAGIPAADLQFVQGRISPTISQINAWLGTQNSSTDGQPHAAYEVLANAGLSPQPTANNTTYAFDHVWVQVTVPGVNNGQPFYLDPSWKAKNYADQNVPAGANALSLVPYNSTGTGGFLTSSVAAPGPIALLDGDFTSPSVSTTDTDYAPSGTAWDFSGNAGVTGDDSGFTSGSPLPPNGQTQVGFIQWTGSVSQTGTFSAGNYTLSLLAAQRENYPHGYQELEILIDGQPIYTFSPTSTSYLAYSTPTFNLTAGQHTIEILGLDPNGQDNTAFITGVQLNSVLTQTPYQWYESQVASALAKNYPGLSLSDITHDGPIIAQQFTNIPQPLPYSSYSITASYSAGPQGNVMASIPADQMARLQITVSNSTNQSFTYTAVLPESLNGQAIGTSPIVLTYSNPTNTGALVPVLEIGGVTVATAPFSIAAGSGSTNDLTITLDQLQIGQSGTVPSPIKDSNGNVIIPADIMHSYTHTAGQVIGIGVDVGQWSDSAILGMQSQLNQLAQSVYIDQSFGNLSEAQATAPLYQNLMVGLAAAKYMNDVDSQSRGIAELTGNVWVGDMSSGITYANALALSSISSLATDEHWDATDPIFSNLATDMPSLNFSYVPVALDLPTPTSVLDWTAPDMEQVFRLVSDNASALEAHTVQEMTNSSAISTVTGFQQALEHGYPLVTITPAQITATGGNTTTTTFGSGTYNTDNYNLLTSKLGRWWSGGNSPYHATSTGSDGSSPSSSSQSVEAQLLSKLDAGYTIIAPDTLVVGPDYATASTPDNSYPNVPSATNNWIGNVWIDEKFSKTTVNGTITSSSADRGMMIAPLYATSGHGGYSAGIPVPVTVSQPTNSIVFNTTGDPVDPYNGNLYHSETDINIPNPGLPLNFSRTYNSLLAAPSGSGAYSSSGAYGSTGLTGVDVGMGNGWTDSYSGFLSVHVATSTTPAEVIYTTSAGDQITFMGNGSGGYTAQGGVYGTLAKQSDGSFLYSDTSGTQYHFIVGLDAVTGSSTASDGGTVYRLNSITDHNGNELALSYDSTTRFLARVTDVQDSARYLTFTWDTNSGDSAFDHIIAITDFTGRTWTYNYATATIAAASAPNMFNNTSVTDLVAATSPPDTNSDNHIVQYTYLTSAANPGDGGSLGGLLSEITDAVTNTSTGVTTNLATYQFNYYPDRRVFSVTDPLGNQERYNYDLMTNQTAYTNELGQTTLYGFNSSGLLTDTINPDQNSATNVWNQPTVANPNAPYQLASTTDAAGYTTQYLNYDAAGNYTQSVSSGGVVTDYAYTTISGPYEVLSAVTLDPTGLNEITTYTYDSHGNRLSMADPIGDKTTYTYNSLGEMTSETQPDGNVAGANAASYTTTYTYDASGQVADTTKDINGVNVTAVNLYDSRGNLTSAQDFNGNTTNYSYDLLGELLTTTTPPVAGAPSGLVTSYTYYDGNKTSVTDPRGLVTTFIYDLKNELVETINPDGTTRLVTYNGLGNVSSRTDENGNTTDYFYNAENHLDDTVNPDNSYTLNVLNGDGQTLLQARPQGLATPYSPNTGETTVNTYNTAGELATSTDALGGQTSYIYDNAGNQTSVTDPNGNTTGFIYNAMNEKTAQIDPAVAFSPGHAVSPATNNWTISGSGADIWGTGDQFNFASQSVTGDGSIVAQVTSATNTDPNAKAGVMFRDGNSAGSAFAFMAISPTEGAAFIWRSSSGGMTSMANVPAATPIWLKLTRIGNTYSGYYSTDGKTWTEVGTPQTLNFTNSSCLAGLAVTSHNNSALSTATFSNVAITAASASPAGWTDADIGNPGLPGSAMYNPTTTYTYDANGNQTSVTDPNGNTITYMYNNLNEIVEKLDPTSGGAPVLADSGFETPVMGSGTYSGVYYKYTPTNTGSGWSFSGNAGISANDTVFTSGNPNAPQGDQVAFIQDISSLSQSATFAASGDYTLSLDAAQRGNGNNGGQTLEILIDNQVVYTFTPTSVNYLTYTTPVFYLTAGNHTVTIEGTDPSLQDNTAFIDAVQVHPATMYSYDNNGNMITTTDANGNITTDQYDALNRKIKQVDPTAGGAGALVDAGFESPVMAPQSSGMPSGTGWTFTGDTGISANDSPYTSANANAPQGNQVAYIQFGSSNLQSGGSYIQQSDTFAAGDYTLSLMAAQRAYWNHGGQTLEILIDNQVVYTFTPTGTSYQLYTTPVFYLTAGIHSVTIAGTDPLGTDNTAFIDDVQMGPTTTWTYDGDGNQTSVTDPNGNTTTYTYNSRNDQTSKTLTSNLSPVTSYSAYDANGNQITAVDPLGGVTQYQYDSMNRNIAQINPAVAYVPGHAVSPATSNWTISGSGGDIWNAADQFNFASQSVTGDGSIVAEVNSQTNTAGWAKAGVMFRDSSAAGSMFADVMVTPSNGVAFMWRNATGATCMTNGQPNIADVPAVTPVWLKLTRVGNTYSGYYSTDGVNWTEIGSPQTIVFSNSTNLAGLAVTAGNNSAVSTVSFSNVAITATPASPTGWTDADIGNPGLPGSAMYDPTTTYQYDLNGNLISTTDPNGNTTQFDYNALNEKNAQIGPQVSVTINTGTESASGTVKPLTTYGYDANGNLISVTSPNGNALSDPAAYTTTYTYNALNEKTAQINPAVAYAPGHAVSPATSNWTISGSGADIWGTGDQFNFASQNVTGDGSIVAQVTSATNTDPNAKAGVMFRDGNSAGSAFAFMAISPTEGAAFIWRSSSGGMTSMANVPAATPIWLKLTRIGNTYSGYYSTDGKTWTEVGTPQTLNFTNSSCLAGLAVTSHNNSALSTATFSNVAITATPASPTGWTDADIGNPGLPGSAMYDPTTTYSYDANGNQIGVTDPNGNTTSYIYNAMNEQTAQINPAVRTTVVTNGVATTEIISPTTTDTYDNNGNVIATTDANGNITQYTYNADNEKISQTAPAITVGSSQVNPSTTYTYDANGNQTSVTDPNGNTTTYTYNALNEKTADIGPAIYDAATGQTVHPTTTYQYDANGDNISVTAPNGNIPGANAAAYTTFSTYNALGEQTAQIQPAAINPATGLPQNPITTNGYDANGNLVSVTDPNGNTTEYFYNALNEKTAQIDPAVAYVPGHAVSPATSNWTISGSGADIWNAADQFNFASQSVTGDGSIVAQVNSQTNTSVWAKAGVMFRDSSAANSMFADVVVTPGEGVAFMWRNSTGGTCSYTDVWAVAAPAWVKLVRAGNVFTGYYSTNGINWTEIGSQTINFANTTNLAGLAVCSHNNNAVSTVNFANVAITAALASPGGWTDADIGNPGLPGSAIYNPTTTYTYDANGNQTSVADPNGNTTQYVYNALNEKTAEIGPQVSVTINTGVLIESGPVNPETTYAYDANGNLIGVTSPNGNALGDPAAYTTTYTYNADNEKISQTAPAITVGSSQVNPVTSYTYDANGNQTTVTDPNGNTTEYTYNSLNEQTSIIQPPSVTGNLPPVTSYTYDLNGNQTSVTDPNGNTTSYVYNAANEQTSTVTNNLPPVTSSYDADGNLVSTINANGLQTTYNYDNLDRQTVEKQYGIGGNLNDTITSTYDPAGRLVSVSDSASTTTYTYDSLNRVTAETTTYAYMTGSVTIDHQYDAAGNTTLTYLTINNGTTSVYDMFTAYTYNAQNMVTMMQRFDLSDGLAAGLISGSQFSSSSGSNTVTPLAVTYSYDASGNMTQLNRYSDLAATQLVASSAYSYNALNTLTAIVTTISGQTTQTYSYSYDAGGLLSQQITPDGTSNFTYDHDNQLLSDSQGSGSYTYDANGNRTSTSSGGTSTASTVGADNQITSSGSTTYTYDKQGNLTSQDTGSQFDTYIWDNRNRLSAVNIEAGLNYSYVGYSYNSQNQLISRYTSTNIFNGSTSTSTQTNQVYVWDGNNLLAVLNVDLPTGVATVAQRFLSGQGENQIIAQENASSTGEAGLVSWAITDNTGSVVDVVANGGGNTILDHIVYDSFGNTVSQTNASNAMLMGYQGYILDSITGLYYANARYYSPQLGRFISQDPSGFSAGDSNLYRFVGNHPTYSVDPTGLYEGGSAFTQGTGSYGGGSGGSNSLIAPWLNLGSGGTNTSVNASPTSLTNTGNAFGGQGPITAPTSAGTSSGFGGSGGYSSGNNSISFNLGAGPSGQGLSSLAPSVYAPMGGGSMPGFSNIPTAASSAAYMQNLSQQYAPSLFGSTALGSAAYGLGQSEVNGAVNAWNYLSSNAPALAEHPSALGPGILQGGANLANEAENIALGIPNAVIAGHNYLTGDNWSQLGSDWSNNLVVQNDTAHGASMGLAGFGLTGLSAVAGAIPGLVGDAAQTTAAFGQSYATTDEWASLLASRYGAENVSGGTSTAIRNAVYGNILANQTALASTNLDSLVAAEQSVPKLLGTVEPPQGLVPGTGPFGNSMHANIAQWLRQQNLGVPFRFNILPGQTGVDVTVPDDYVGQVGFKYAEIKPQSTSGLAAFQRQNAEWGYQPGEVQPITYDQNGNIYDGF